MKEMLIRRAAGSLSKKDERALYLLHCQRFSQRVHRLPKIFFPGEERSRDAIRSLANGAYASFCNPVAGREPMFDVAARLDASKCCGFLYRWPGSATMEYVRAEAGPRLDALYKYRRNVGIHLRCGPFRCVHGTGRTRQWVPCDWGDAFPRVPRPAPRRALRGIMAVRTVLDCTGRPMTRVEIAEHWMRSSHLLHEEEAASNYLEEAPDSAPGPEALMIALENEMHADSAVRLALSRMERKVLAARGYADDRRSRAVPFREVAARLGSLTAERYRQIEKSAISALRMSARGRHFSRRALQSALSREIASA